jgi:hypothetical protein
MGKSSRLAEEIVVPRLLWVEKRYGRKTIHRGNQRM